MSSSGKDQGQPKDSLFKNMDEQERMYAPEQLPGNERTTAGHENTVDREAVVGSEGQYAPPVIPAQSTIGASANTPVPPAPAPDLQTGREQRERDQARERE